MHSVTNLNPRSVRFAERAEGHDVIENILVVVDPTAVSHPCIEKAARLAAAFGSSIELYICDVAPDVPESWAGGSTLAQYRSLMRERRIQMLEELAAPLRARGIHVNTESEWHSPLEQGVVEHAIRTRAGLVVKDTHRHAPESHMPTVQTDWALLRQLPMPLLLVRSGSWDAHPVVAASVDPCHVAERPVELDLALVALGSSIKRALSGSLTLVHALRPTPHLPSDSVPAAVAKADQERQRARVATLAREAHVDACDSLFSERDAPEGIVELTQQIRPAVLVIGVAARQRLQGGAVSTASQVLERIDCDLLAVKPAGFVSPALVTG